MQRSQLPLHYIRHATLHQYVINHMQYTLSSGNFSVTGRRNYKCTGNKIHTKQQQQQKIKINKQKNKTQTEEEEEQQQQQQQRRRRQQEDTEDEEESPESQTASGDGSGQGGTCLALVTSLQRCFMETQWSVPSKV